MSDSLLEEYKAYYKTRADRFKDNPNYKNSFIAEQDLSSAMQSCDELIEFKEKVGNKNIKCGIALVQDKYEMRKQHYTDMQETIRLSVVNDVIESVVEAKTAMDVATKVTDVETKGMIKISMDESNREMLTDWYLLDRVEIYENAEVPDKYKSKLQDWATEIKDNLVKSNLSLEQNHNEWEAGWKHKPELILEHRHKRLFPYKPEHIEEQLNKYRNILNR